MEGKFKSTENVVWWMFELGNINESICFTTESCCIYEWQDIERLRGGSETCVEIEQDLFLEVLFLFCCRKLRYSWLWCDKLCTKRTRRSWYYNENNCMPIWWRVEMYFPGCRCTEISKSWRMEAEMPRFIAHIFLKRWKTFRNHYISRDKFCSSRKTMAKRYEDLKKMVQNFKFRQF